MKQRQTYFWMGALNEEDIHGLIQLSASVGWDYDEREISTAMSVGTVYGHKDEQGKIISSAAIIPYNQKLASIGMVIVNHNYRGLGLGSDLTTSCIQSVADHVTIMLIATEEGVPLYEKLGFHTVTYVHKFLCDKYVPLDRENEDMEYEIRPFTETHLEQIRELDQKAFGADRSVFLKSRLRQAKKSVVARQKNGTCLGYGFSIEGPVNLILGPIISTNYDVAYRILHELANEHQGKLRIDVPDGQETFMQYLERVGFRKVSQPPVMIKNSNSLPERENTLYSISAQIFG
ncbi:GNAT family N-acetyltransferase [Paenibacillus sp. GCM10027626]|uniref:GNAT family N-acetyltransferase n=1 Tax=Paenibacillus sp. GCM10027626 TaxID=3273411 RepID=UPI003624D7CF